MSPRLLILTAGYGEGHNAAARALQRAATAAAGEDAARVVDVFAEASPRTHRLSRRFYRQLIDRAPHWWCRTYQWIDRSRHFPRVVALLTRERRVLARLIADHQPTALCSTYPLYGCILAAVARRQGMIPPHFVVVTDSITINSLWRRGRCDRWFVPNPDSAQVLRAQGIPSDRLHALGFPVDPGFARAPLPRPSLGAGARPRVLCLINSDAAMPMHMARELLLRDDWEVTCAVSQNERLRRALAGLAVEREPEATVLGWTDRIPELLQTHHVVISKAGGATTQEALAAGCPMVVNQIIPGQEEGNYELLRRHAIGDLARTPGELVRTLEAAFADGGRQWRKWQRAAASLARPAAAGAIVAEIFARSPSVPSPPSPSAV